MGIRVGINGFGRIGRNFFRAAKQTGADLDVVAVNDLGDAETMAHLLRYDSVLGPFQGEVELGDGVIRAGGEEMKMLSERDPSAIAWGDLGVDVVLESTGFFTKRDGAQKHLDAGAKKVLISAPATEPDVTIVLGVNDDAYDPETHHIVSNASCTTNCVAPLAKVVDDFAGIDYRPNGRFRVTHTGAMFGKRDPRPFLTAFARADLERSVARFVGDFRQADREWVDSLGLGERLEIHPYVPRRESLAFQRDSEALLLLMPEVPGRGSGVVAAKVFEYLAAERPIIAAVPPDGATADFVREAGAGTVVAPDDADGIEAALRDLHARWTAGSLDGTPLAPELRTKLDRRTRAEEFARVLRDVT